MTKARMGAGLVAGCLLLWGSAASAATPAQILQYRPKQEGIIYSTPNDQELNNCKVKWTANPQGGGVWQLSDPQGRLLRRLVDTKGDGKPHSWSYYHEGTEVYREIDTTGSGQPDQYRWLNKGGMKWGVDLNKDHKIDAWRMISAEEVSQEILQAVITKDFSRLQPLFLSENDMKVLGLPPAESAQILETQKQAPAKFQNTLTRLANLNGKTRWLHLETSAPQCLPADTLGTKQDLIKYGRGTILCETEGKHEWLQTGEMIKVGLTWRIIDAPTAGDGSESEGTNLDPALQALLDQLKNHDAKAPKAPEVSGPNADLVTYNLQRADLLEQIVAKVKPEEREQWIRQVADCLSAAAQYSPENNKSAYERLMRLEKQIIEAVPQSPLAAYVVFREMSAENAAKLGKPGPDSNKIQEQWLGRLAKFVETYAKAEDTPDALMQLAMVNEVSNKEVEAKNWYARLVKDFPDHPQAAKARGALRRLELEGKPLELTGPLLNGGTFNFNQLRGKTVVVYYWASYINKERSAADFAALKVLLENYATKGLALVCINLDNTVEEANAFLQRLPAPGIHLFQAGGLESPLATQYGIMALPNLFLVDKDGKVLSRTVQQVSSLDEELKKVLK
jgi:hypothetical protein